MTAKNKAGISLCMVAFVPTVKFLLGVSNVSVPWDTLFLSVVLFLVKIANRTKERFPS